MGHQCAAGGVRGVVTQVHFILGGELVRRCWVQQLEAAESNVDRLCRIPDSAPRDKVRTWHDSFEARARDVSSLQRAGASPPLSYSTHVRVGSLAGWLASYILLGVPAGTRITTTCQLFRRRPET